MKSLGNSPGSELTSSLENLSEGSWQSPCGSQLMYFKKKKIIKEVRTMERP